jgi:hypothetical protein
METKDWWSIIRWHLIDILKEFRVFSSIWNVIIEISNQLIEAVVRSEDLLLDPELGVA